MNLTTTNQKKKRVVIAFSGGVDSSVSAYLLLQQNYEVIGVFMRNWDSSLNNEILNSSLARDKKLTVCAQEADYEMALAAAKTLKIKLFRVDFIREYWELIFQTMLETLQEGKTPNPDIWCNRYIKFDLFINYVIKKWNPDFIATGHYAQLISDQNQSYLKIAVDETKDQTYFLCQIHKNTLSTLLFPIGHLTKSDVRTIADKINLPNANKRSSSGICFIGDRKYQKFLQNYFPLNPGLVINWIDQKVVGKHDGHVFYTIGQRKGLNIIQNPQSLPYFIVKKDPSKNYLYICFQPEYNKLTWSGCLIDNINWLIAENEINWPLSCQIKIRYRSNLLSAILQKVNENIKIEFLNPPKNITPGQFAVLYKNDLCLGGGQILDYKITI